MITYAALDLSLDSTGGVSVPAGWGGDWSLVERVNIGKELPKDAPLPQQVQRISEIANDVADWLFWLCEGDPEKLKVWVEDLPRFGKNVFKTIELAMLRGVVQDHLAPFHIYLEALPLSSCRKTLLGHVSKVKGEAKRRAIAMVHDISGDMLKSDDEADAFVVLNHGCSLVGEHFFSLPSPPRRSR